MRRWQMSGKNETVLDAMWWGVVSIINNSIVDRAVGGAVYRAVYRAVGGVVDMAVYNRVTNALDEEVGNVWE
jgi:hypothetical protein